MNTTIRTAILLLACAAAVSAQTPAGGEFRVSTYTAGRQDLGIVAMEPDGDFIVVWTDFVPKSAPTAYSASDSMHRGRTGGCSPTEYCPASSTTREQMAVFVLRTLESTLSPPDCVPPNLYFDVPETNPFCRWIEQLTNRNVVSGCGNGIYCQRTT